MGMVHFPPFVGCGEENPGEQVSFVYAESGGFFQKSFDALPFLTSRIVWIIEILINPAGFGVIRRLMRVG